MEYNQPSIRYELLQLTQIEFSLENMREELAAYINDLISKDFPKLINLLYRIDVSEDKLKKTLKDQSTINAGLLIADLILARQKAKLAAREKMRDQENDEPNVLG